MKARFEMRAMDFGPDAAALALVRLLKNKSVRKLWAEAGCPDHNTQNHAPTKCACGSRHVVVTVNEHGHPEGVCGACGAFRRAGGLVVVHRSKTGGWVTQPDA